MRDWKFLPKSAKRLVAVGEAREVLVYARTADEIADAIRGAISVMGHPPDSPEDAAAWLPLSYIAKIHDEAEQLQALKAVQHALSAVLLGYLAHSARITRRDLSSAVVKANLTNGRNKNWFREKAAAEWEHSKRNISQMADLLKSGESPSAKTIRKWIGDLCPSHLKKRGRPRNFIE